MKKHTVKKNVMFAIWALEPGGAEQMVISLASGLDRTRYNPIICCLNHKGRFASRLEQGDVKVIELNKGPAIDFLIIPKLIKVMRRYKIDIVHTHLWTADFWGRIAAKLAGIPIIISTAHNVDIWKPKLFLWFDRVLSKSTDKIIAVSKKVRLFYIEKAGIEKDKLITIYNGVASKKTGIEAGDRLKKRKELDLGSKDKIIAVIGRLVEQKGHIYFLEAMKKISSEIPKLKALIIGDGPLKNRLMDKARELGLEGKVIFTGIREDISEILPLIQFLVMPSLYEGLPIVALEAMAQGKPIIATEVGGIPEAVLHNKTGILVPPGNPSLLAESIIQLTESCELRKSFGKEAKKLVREQFDLKQMLKHTQAIYDEASNPKKQLKILLIIDSLGYGGAETQAIELAKSIDKNKFNLKVISLDKDRRDLLPELVHNNISVSLIDQKGKFCIPTFINLFKIIRKEKPDIIHTYLFTASFYGRIVGKLLGVPIIIHSERSPENWKKKSYILADRLLAKWTSHFLANAKIIKQSLISRERIPEGKIRVIHNGIDLNKFNNNLSKQKINLIRKALNIQNGGPTVLIIGRLSAEKGHKIFLQSAQYVLAHIPKANFLVIGDGELRKNLTEQVGQMGLDNRVIFAGNKNNVPEILKVVDVVVSGSFYEGCSNAILEAMAAGRPIVATNVGDNSYLMKNNENGLLIPAGNSRIMAWAITKILLDKKLAGKMGKKGRERVEKHFNLQKMVRATEDFYQELASNH